MRIARSPTRLKVHTVPVNLWSRRANCSAVFHGPCSRSSSTATSSDVVRVSFEAYQVGANHPRGIELWGRRKLHGEAPPGGTIEIRFHPGAARANADRYITTSTVTARYVNPFTTSAYVSRRHRSDGGDRSSSTKLNQSEMLDVGRRRDPHPAKPPYLPIAAPNVPPTAQVQVPHHRRCFRRSRSALRHGAVPPPLVLVLAPRPPELLAASSRPLAAEPH